MFFYLFTSAPTIEPTLRTGDHTVGLRLLFRHEVSVCSSILAAWAACRHSELLSVESVLKKIS